MCKHFPSSFAYLQRFLASTRKILEGGTTFCKVYMQRFRSVWCSKQRVNSRWREIKTKIQFGPFCGVSLLALITTFIQNYYNNQLVVTPNEMVGLYCPDHPSIERPAAIFVWFVSSTRIFLAKAVYMVLRSSWYQGLPISQLRRSQLVLGRSQRQGQVKPFGCKLNTET